MKKYALFIGRWQTWHEGHQWLIDQQFQKGKNVWIAIRDVNTDKDNPKTAHEVMMELTQKLRGYVSTAGTSSSEVDPQFSLYPYSRVRHEQLDEIGLKKQSVAKEMKEKD
jgi:D-hexose-6-phosphate mutarotase